MTISIPIQHAVLQMQTAIRANSIDKGFAEEGDRILASGDPVAIRNYFANRLMLIVGEVIEAHEELRKGMAMGDMYYSEGKPEGIPSELADIVIRTFDLAAEAEIDLAQVIMTKMAFNATRPPMHGGKAF